MQVPSPRLLQLRFYSILSLALILSPIATVLSAEADYSVTPINIPSAQTVYPMGINDHGDVVGFYYANNTINVNYGFIWKDGVSTTFRFPGSRFTDVRDINNNREIVGGYLDPTDNQWKTFLYHDGEISAIPDVPVGRGFAFRDGIPSSDFPGVPWDMNDQGDRVGDAYLMLQDGTLRTFDGVDNLYGNNSLGQIVGFSHEYPTSGVLIQLIPEPSPLYLTLTGLGLLLTYHIRLGPRSRPHLS